MWYLEISKVKKCFVKNRSFSYMIFFVVYIKQNMCEFEVLLILLIRKDIHKHNTLKIVW